MPGPQHTEVSPGRCQAVSSVPLSSLQSGGQKDPQADSMVQDLASSFKLSSSQGWIKKCPCFPAVAQFSQLIRGQMGNSHAELFSELSSLSVCPGDSLTFPDYVCPRVEGALHT